MHFLTSVIYNTKVDAVESHCWGYFPGKDVVEGVIYRDRGDFHDLYYPYLVVEDIPEDILNPAITEVAWYAFNDTRMEWEVCPRPEALDHISGFALRR